MLEEKFECQSPYANADVSARECKCCARRSVVASVVVVKVPRSRGQIVGSEHFKSSSCVALLWFSRGVPTPEPPVGRSLVCESHAERCS